MGYEQKRCPHCLKSLYVEAYAGPIKVWKSKAEAQVIGPEDLRDDWPHA